MALISVIATVKNEGEALRPLLDSLTHQTLPPDEIVIADGGSTDNTRAILEEYQQYLPLIIIDAADSNISAGRNQAIAAAKGEIIAATDAGVVLTPVWVAEITKPIRAGQAQVVSGWFEQDPYTDFEVVMGATVLPSLDDIDPDSFLPSSRSIAFHKSLWVAVDGYPEWLDFCEDLLFDFALREQVGAFAFAPRAIAYFRPRGNMRAFAKQYFLYARGDGKADLWRKRHMARYVAYLLAAPLLLLGMIRGKQLSWLLLTVGGLVYCKRPFERLYDITTGWRFAARLYAFALVLVIRLVGDVAKMLGYPVGLLWRMKQRLPHQ
ncbi:MAG TPA: glycosyltransferase [Anaerolineae bacterium]|nr:glycosyltransferase [Anaerolineae bacterium]